MTILTASRMNVLPLSVFVYIWLIVILGIIVSIASVRPLTPSSAFFIGGCIALTLSNTHPWMCTFYFCFMFSFSNIALSTVSFSVVLRNTNTKICLILWNGLYAKYIYIYREREMIHNFVLYVRKPFCLPCRTKNDI